MVGYLSLNSSVQYQWLKVVTTMAGFQVIKFNDYDRDSISSKLRNNDMFAGNQQKLVILFDKDNASEMEFTLSLAGEEDVIMAIINVDKRTSIHRQLSKLKSLRYDWWDEVGNPDQAIIKLVENNFKLSLINQHLLKSKNLDFDELFNQICLKMIGSDLKQLDLKQLDLFSEDKISDQSLFDAVLEIIKYPDSSAIARFLQQYSAESIWNTLIWYVDLIFKSQVTNGMNSSIKINPYVLSKVRGIKLNKLDAD
ncbi:MAG: hypothetical protein WAS94_03400, partial [Candidatus Saccharimonadales bacterium]